MDQILSQYNCIAESVSQHVPDSLLFYNEVRRLYDDIKRLKSQIKAWTRLLVLGSIQVIPMNSMMELQLERQRIYNSMQNLHGQVERERINIIMRGGGSGIQPFHRNFQVSGKFDYYFNPRNYRAIWYINY